MISIVVPMYNEADAAALLYDRLTGCAAQWGEAYEIILVDDGSRDATLELCLQLHARDPHVKVLSFTRNFGHQAAVTAGLCYATGDLIAVIDADLQDPPEELGRFFAKCREGYDVVYAIRAKRKEGPLKRMCYWLFYRTLSRLATIDIPLDSGDFCVMTRRVVESINALPERSRFVRGLRSWIGFRQTGLAYERHTRQAGTPKYTFRKLANLALDGLINFSYQPLRLLMLTGIAVAGLAFVAGILILFQYLSNTTILGYNPRQARGWTSLILAVLFLAGTQLFGMGMLGEYIGRLFEEAKARPMYMIDRQVGFGHEERRHPGRIGHA